MDEAYFQLFDKCRNLIPIMSIEGEKEITDERRGQGIYDRLIRNMDELHKRDLIFGASVTVTTQNMKEVTSDAFLKKLSEVQKQLFNYLPTNMPHARWIVVPCSYHMPTIWQASKCLWEN